MLTKAIRLGLTRHLGISSGAKYAMIDTPYPFQAYVAKLLLIERKNVILQAPTGSGKTLAALLPFLNAYENNRCFPRKCIYSVPMRVLANQFVHEYREDFKRAGRENKISVSIQTGDQPGAPLFAEDLVFATIDQTLSSFLLAPYSLSRTKANLNAAAIMASYLVFDEFHLYDPGSTLPTTLHMLQLLKGITPFVLMTATFSANMLGALAEQLDATVVPGSLEERVQLRNLPSQNKTRRYHLVDAESQPLSAEKVLDCHHHRSLVICNTVDRARAIYAQLLDATRGTETRVLMLHSRFLRDDRDRIEDEIRASFGKKADYAGGSLIVVSTQAIEVGVDITCTALHTELAPANAILQRAGRCARYEGNEGDVFVYRYTAGSAPGDIVDLLERPAPYMSQEDEFGRTRDAFLAHDGAPLDFTQEQEVVSAVHGPRDAQIVAQLRAESNTHRQRMYAVMRGDEGQDARNLIREVRQQLVTIHAHPDDLLEAPFAAPSFGLHYGSLQKLVTDWLEKYNQDESIPWAVKWLKEDLDQGAEQANRKTYRWVCVQENAHEVLGSPLVVVHPMLATYDPALGFLPNRGGDWQAELPPRPERRERDSYTYRLETYERHIELVHQAAFEPIGGFWHEMAWLARQLEARFGWAPGSIRRAAELAVLLHDVGKLSVKWQGWVRDYQARIDRSVDTQHAYAHTDLFAPAHREKEKKTPKRPWHAVEGAVAVLPMLAHELGADHSLTDATFSAIARHHSANSASHQTFRLIADAARHIRATVGEPLPVEPLGIEQDIASNVGAEELIAVPRDGALEAFWAYLLLARVLRRADQAGTAKGSKESDT